MKDCQTISEYAIKKWMENNNFAMSEFSVKVLGNIGTITDRTGDPLIVEYMPITKTVEVKE